jgi:hypothetical protein
VFNSVYLFCLCCFYCLFLCNLCITMFFDLWFSGLSLWLVASVFVCRCPIVNNYTFLHTQFKSKGSFYYTYAFTFNTINHINLFSAKKSSEAVASLPQCKLRHCIVLKTERDIVYHYGSFCCFKLYYSLSYQLAVWYMLFLKYSLFKTSSLLQDEEQ